MLRYKMFLGQSKKKNEAGNSLNTVERKPVPTRFLNPNASEASYKPKQRSYRKTKLNFFFFRGNFSRGILSGYSQINLSGILLILTKIWIVITIFR